jgi:hypothetical protein
MKTKRLLFVLFLIGLVMPLACGKESPKSQTPNDTEKQKNEKPAVVAASETPVATKPMPKPAEESPPAVEDKPTPTFKVGEPFLGEKDAKTRQQQMCVMVMSSVAGKFEVSFRFYKDDGTDLIKPYPSTVVQLEANKTITASVYFKEPAGKYNCSVRMEHK